MSLNGLDDPKVKEAHETAVAEPGGWFLLKYASRDEVELLGRGNGGIVEVRNNISQYEDTSPLYGFLRYRRRNVLIKYLPEDCSRLVQARVTVHFNSVCERFAPYDTTFSIATAKELKDTKLSAACSLHTASGSTSSSTSSLRRRRLMEIAEEEEEEQRAKRQSVVKEEDSRPATAGVPSESGLPTSPPVALNADLAASPEQSQFASTTEPPSFTGVPRPASPAKSFDQDTAQRYSFQSGRPDLYSYSSYTYGKPRVKLGPRPSLDASGRPKTAGGYRPVSTIPAGLKLSKGSKRGKSQDKGQDTSDSTIKEAPEITFLATSIPIPENLPLVQDTGPIRPHTSGGSGRPATSSGVSIKSAMASIAPPTKQNTITPEKARLMKAMQLREKKKKQSLQSALPSPPPTVSEVSSIREEPVPAEVIPEETEDNESQDLPSMLQVDRLSMSKADSGIDVASSIHNDHVSVDSQLDSHPASPIGASSEIGDSTKASSLSESTDETVHVNEEKPVPQDDDEEPEADVNEKITGDDNEINEEDTPIAEVQDIEETIETHDVPAEEKVEEEVENDEPTVETEVLPVETEQRLPEPSPVLPISKFAARAQDLPEVMESIERDPEVSEPTHVSDLKQDDVKSASPVSPQFKLPKSKFSTQDMTSIASPAVPAIVTPPEEANEEAAPEHVIVAKASIDVETASIDSKRSKRRALVEPIKTNLELPERDNGLSDDDDLMDELQDAVVEEAKPIAVSKSPISPVFASSPPKQTARNVRTVSNPIRGPLLAPGDVSTSSARSLSGGAAFLHKLTQQQSSSHLAPKTGKIGSNISQRIKALEMLSVSSGAPTEGVPKERPSSAFFSVRRGSVRDPARSPSVAERANSLTRGGLTPSPPRSRETSPEENKAPSRERSASVASRLSMFEGGNAPRGRPDSVQVTARIIRDPSQPFPKTPELRTDSTEYTPVEFRQSTLIVDLQKSAPSLAPSPALAVLAEPPQEPRPSIQERRLSKDKKRRSQSEDRTEDKLEGNRPRRRSSLSIVKDFIKERRGSLIGKSPSTDNLNLTSPALSTPGTGRSPSRPPSVHTNTGFTGRLSISSRRSSISRDNVITPPTPGNPLSPSLMTETSGSGDEKQSDRKSISGSSTKDGKSRASRFMRRLSSSLSSGRNKLPPSISPTVTEEDAAEVEASIGVPPSRGSINPNVPSIVAYLGDVNVQFPDNLLWKRRTMCLDSQGFLILSAVQGVTATTTAAAMGREKQAGAIKRYHLSDFRQPYTPEMEVQELPNSVCLDFVDGSGLQIACEDRAGQLNVLHILQDAHQNHTSFGL